jgi:hypothetical protein
LANHRVRRPANPRPRAAQPPTRSDDQGYQANSAERQRRRLWDRLHHAEGDGGGGHEPAWQRTLQEVEREAHRNRVVEQGKVEPEHIRPRHAEQTGLLHEIRERRRAAARQQERRAQRIGDFAGRARNEGVDRTTARDSVPKSTSSPRRTAPGDASRSTTARSPLGSIHRACTLDSVTGSAAAGVDDVATSSSVHAKIPARTFLT